MYLALRFPRYSKQRLFIGLIIRLKQWSSIRVIRWESEPRFRHFFLQNFVFLQNYVILSLWIGDIDWLLPFICDTERSPHRLKIGWDFRRGKRQLFDSTKKLRKNVICTTNLTHILPTLTNDNTVFCFLTFPSFSQLFFIFHRITTNPINGSAENLNLENFFEWSRSWAVRPC